MNFGSLRTGFWKVIWPTEDDVMRGWRKLHYEKLHTQCSPLYIARITKFRRIR